MFFFKFDNLLILNHFGVFKPLGILIVKEADYMRYFQSIGTGAVLPEDELYQLYLNEWNQMWDNPTPAIRDFTNKEDFINYMTNNDLYNDFEEVY